MTGLCIILVVALASVSIVGCRATQADRPAEKCQVQELQLDENQIEHIKDSIQKRFQWDAYWTYNDNSSQSAYSERTLERVSLVLFSLKRGVVVVIPTLEKFIVFRKSPEGAISSPYFVPGGGPAFDGDFDGYKAAAMAKDLGDNSRELLLELGKAFPQIIHEEQVMKDRMEHSPDSPKYCQTKSDMRLLPLTVPTYDPMDERKEALLGAIVEASIKHAQTMFTKGETITITLPNFNVSDERIWILLEDGKAEAYTVHLNITVMNTEVSASYGGTVEIRSNPKYGIRIGAEEKIKRDAIKILKYKVQ